LIKTDRDFIPRLVQTPELPRVVNIGDVRYSSSELLACRNYSAYVDSSNQFPADFVQKLCPSAISIIDRSLIQDVKAAVFATKSQENKAPGIILQEVF
jgi:hypothetical protein